MKWFVVLLITSVWYVAALAQQDAPTGSAFADSLERLVRQSPDDSTKIERLLELSFYWSDRDTSKAFDYIEKAKQIMGPDPNGYYRGLLWHHRANIIYAHDMEKAKSYYLRAVHLLAGYAFPRAYVYQSRAWNNYGTLLQAQDSAAKYLDIIIERALPYSRMAGDSSAVSQHLQNIGLILANLQDFESAAHYYKEAMHTLSKFEKAYENKLTVYVNAAKNEMNLGNIDQAKTYLDSAGIQLEAVPHSTYAPYYYRTVGVYFRKLKDKNRALESFHRGITIAEDLLDDFAQRDLYFEIYATYRDWGEYANAKKYLAIANTHAPNTVVENRLLNAREMAKTEYHLGNYKAAFEQMQDYALAKDSLLESETALKILNLEKRFQTVEQENEILKLQDANRRQQSAIDRNRLWIMLLVASLTIALTIAYFSWKLASSNRRALGQQERLHEEELLNLKQQEQLRRFDSILQSQEEERNRISRDLHDGLGGLLAGVKLRLSAVATKEREQTSVPNKEVESVIVELDRSVDELRRVARNLMPESLLYMGLKPALADLCEYMDTPTTSVKFHGFDLRATYPQVILIGVYRIVQELLNNAIKHARAGQIIVQCGESNQMLSLTVEDDGCGFNPREVGKKGLGVKNVENRVALLHGTVEIDSQPGRGTTVNIEIPILNG
ncbi:tetratricopeptide repeat-containing sensor histidine kinase [Parapedobacter sp.]